MDLPDRASRYLEMLEDFVRSPSTPLLEEARVEFFGDDRLAEGEEARDLLDYALFDYRDASGRCAAELFLEAHGDSLAREERDVLRGLGRSVGGIFVVEEVRPGECVKLRRAGSEECFEVAEVEGSRDVEKGMGILTRLVPYRGRFEFTERFVPLPPEVVYVTERTMRRGILGEDFSISKLLRALRRKTLPPENRLEAELLADVVFAEVKFPLTVEDTQNRFQEVESMKDLLAEFPIQPRCREDMERFATALTGLWHYTPRRDLGGLSIDEKQKELERSGSRRLPEHLLKDLAQEIDSRLGTRTFPDKASRQDAFRVIEEAWLDTPQEELGGQTPRQVIDGAGPELPPLPPESGLPPPGRPAWTPEFVTKLLRAGPPHLKGWAFVWAARHPEGFEESDTACALRSLLEQEDWRIQLDAVFDAMLYEGHPHAGALASVLAGRMPEEMEELHSDTILAALGALDAPNCLDAFLEHLDEEDDMVVESAVEGVARSGCEHAGEILHQLALRTPFLGARRWAATALGNLRDAPAFEEALRLVIQPPEDPAENLVEICENLGEVLSEALHTRAASELREKRQGDPALSFLFPAVDPVAAARAGRVVPPARRAELAALAGASRWEELSVAFATLALDAIDLAVSGTPDLHAWGGVLRALSKSIIEVSRKCSSPDSALGLAIDAGTILACGIRGRDIPREKLSAGADPEKLLALLRVDDAWLDEGVLRIAASALPEESLAPFLEVSDVHVHANARAILSVKKPAEHLSHLVRCACGHNHPEVWDVVKVVGDSLLLLLYEVAAGHPDGRHLLTRAFVVLGTERAKAMLDHCADPILGGLTLTRVADLLLTCGSRNFAEKAFHRISSGDVRYPPVAKIRLFLEEIALRLQSAAELHGLSVDPNRVLAEGKARSLRSGLCRPLLAAVTPLVAEDEEAWDDTLIEPDAPCPCGSGKKYGNCCGRVV